ncbi:hypothetical protein PIB19_12635 [Sphingomonas sp. 7/4-4]|uniref:hypothetical protein n=1 Tax=Sphingomonas sp. 7/4-4 TaxID=3018446 RepID=UPI0022F3DA5A|nr:hypothetical protein [Sphingomonas sp. 7/4-4]WBY06443.1 hypothetical protein PIB19_12635 [Sphingomonas sp. 7/4-4]
MPIAIICSRVAATTVSTSIWRASIDRLRSFITRCNRAIESGSPTSPRSRTIRRDWVSAASSRAPACAISGSVDPAARKPARCMRCWSLSPSCSPSARITGRSASVSAVSVEPRSSARRGPAGSSASRSAVRTAVPPAAARVSSPVSLTIAR